ncbi:maleylpyruvate isomerase family mycothiol-dependent enzyme [Mycolicibacterium wolinskyi]|uniref:maleylpyruvate isomerase family mycothiol-dependent enzyme n=1 Tax=Mycolicibacterium wolinskyi TaxID=59750 RepID=UPI001F428DA2|nr:maleylpyruvate isomerase family mycothiol-dependent enzyme [Mycolicibacterium wolinskyi]
MAVTDAVRAVGHYQETKDRIVELVSESDASWSTAVAACPGWSVRDVVAHMTAVAEDWVSGRLAGAPTDEQTAAQVARFGAFDTAGILTAWDDAASELARKADSDGLKPPLGDIVVHEHDIRAALGRPGARDSDAARSVCDQLLANLRTPVPLVVAVEDAEYRSGPDSGAEIRLDTTRFEVLRWRTGRRSRAQLAAMDWSGDPAPVLDSLYLFGPADADFIE